jgi:hypothetical protein
MSNADRIPTLASVLRSSFITQAEDLHVALPCRVESYDATTQRVSVQPVLKRSFTDEEGERQVERLPVISNCPVQFPQGGGYRLTFPVAVGDTGMLLFSEASLDVWLSEGGEVDPVDDRRFDLSDGVFLPGVRSFANALSDASADHMTMGKEGGLQIHIDGASINIGSNNGAELEAVALYETLRAELEDLRTKFNTHTHPTAPVGPVSPPSVILSPGWPADFSSSSVKVKT